MWVGVCFLRTGGGVSCGLSVKRAVLRTDGGVLCELSVKRAVLRIDGEVLCDLSVKRAVLRTGVGFRVCCPCFGRFLWMGVGFWVCRPCFEGLSAAVFLKGGFVCPLGMLMLHKWLFCKCLREMPVLKGLRVLPFGSGDFLVGGSVFFADRWWGSE